MSNNRTRNDYIICMCTRCTVSNPSGKCQRKQNAKRHYKQYGAPVLAASAMDMRNENVDRMEIDYNSDVDVDFNVNEEDYAITLNPLIDNEYTQPIHVSLLQEDAIFFSEDAGPQSFVIDGDDIEEGGTSFGFEKDEAFEDPALSSMKMQAHQYPLNNMSVYIRFMAIFIVIFHLVFLVDNDGSILIEFCNILLSLFDLTGALPLTIDSLKHITGFNTATGGITVYVTCSKCHTIYPPNTSTKNCTFKLFTHSNTCNNALFKSTSGNRSSPVMWKEAKNAAEHTRLERSNGTRWSQLHLLTYFDPVRCTIIDPMHNLFLGTAKCMVQIWKELEYFDNQTLLAMQDLANGVVVPPDYARINKKIADGFSFMKADEWKLWCLIYSLFILKRILPVKHLSNWMFFVNACRLLTKPSVTPDDISSAHAHLQSFCKGFEKLYKEFPVTPNMHLHLHLGKCINDFGPIYAFWLFSFERYNGLLKNLDTNQKGEFEVTMMKRFLEKAYVGNYIRSFEEKFPASTVNFLHSITRSQVILEQPSSMSSLFILSTFIEYSMNPRKSVMGCEPLPSDVLSFKVEPKIVMCKEHYECLYQYYKDAYNSHNIFGHYSDCRAGQIFVNNRIIKVKQISLLGQQYFSGSYFQALFVEKKSEDISAFPGRILYLFQHTLNFGNIDVIHTFAFVEWYASYSSGNVQPLKNEKIELWQEPSSLLTYENIIPVHRLYSPVAVAKYRPTITSDFKRLVIPLPKKIEY
ncbi:hypothetical protein PHYBLDRAFT_163625 [Phycomyces blakesleeanus NRRL 1555(-)]|uniref:Transposase domain-containing protein n=1 Tax=Phycomyces blakesleeanus (strain ATCC 8743b / DSM 1359 / FGSC 10004 / NBRC 33097 / NRRL 1555) TaxID=763407 RepID=A0A167PTK4_PHYB8|nr:hypothetical protein PHYBLDRAFT_163625 [Phycomyces blakesleeanus NRRL 1555(-)]OAD78516.1 hypothetical protein PHYBLDRAFT_163625 [Phycomyces blakesleeanus NRRL 1555(-)]|eukprot:XP_018296556.1 hypothetical protein PHYBLDRAFT_163625 [Phycomyces blakesleeanus NRRL 1555(-)]